MIISASFTSRFDDYFEGTMDLAKTIAGRERVRNFRLFLYLIEKYGGQRRDRTADAGLFRAALYH
jgi:hypothetical protein